MGKKSVHEQALEEHEERLCELPNVVGLGIVAIDTDDDRPEHLAVAVYVSKKLPAQQLTHDELVPGVLEVQSQGRMERVPVKVIEIGVPLPE